MRLRFFVIILYSAALAWFVAVPLKSVASDATTIQQARPVLGLDIDGKRGLVLFHHSPHESASRTADFSPPFLNKPADGLSCVVCHHRRDTTDPSRPDITEVTDVKQFQKCSACHRPEGDSRNFYDREGYELSNREAYHRLCVGCHMTKADLSSRGMYRTGERIPLKCADCHEREGTFVANTEMMPPSSGEERAPIIEPEPPLIRVPPFATPVDPPTGYAGASRISNPKQESADAIPQADRWRIGFPEDPRYQKGEIYNPYRQNVVKGDYPLFGQHNFFVLTAESESFVNAKRIPVPSNVAAQRPDSEEFFGRGGQFFFRQNFSLSLELFHGDTSFKPIDWRIHITPNFNINYLHTQENGIVNIDFRRGNTRTDGYVSLQEAFGEVRLGDTTRVLPFLRGGRAGDRKSPYFDTTSVRAGIQTFISDFRGFIFDDTNLGLRVFGNYANNRWQYNAAYFYMLEKDTNSDLNTPHFRNQTVFIANLFRQDTKFHGYTTEFSFHYNDDRPSRQFDENDFLVRPALIGDVKPHGIKAYYLGWTGDGHMGRWNISHAFYQALGHDSHNPIAGRKVDINAQMAAAELSLDRDWLRFKGSFFWASGDKKPFDGTARGFDSIQDHQEFAGGAFSFWNSQGIPLTNTAVLLTTPGSLLPDLRSSKTQGQSNFVNPGIFVYNVGAEAEMTQKLRTILNLNYSHFHHTEPLSELLFQPNIRKPVGVDYGVGVLYRPFLSENWIVSAGFSSLIPGTGFRDIYSSNCNTGMCGARSKILYSAFVKLKFVY
ncbi:MAG TPA: cytochrome c3 family protein [Blastocatellia bacterium]